VSGDSLDVTQGSQSTETTAPRHAHIAGFLKRPQLAGGACSLIWASASWASSGSARASIGARHPLEVLTWPEYSHARIPAGLNWRSGGAWAPPRTFYAGDSLEARAMLRATMAVGRGYARTTSMTPATMTRTPTAT